MTAAKPEISCLNGMDTLTPKQRSVRMSMIRSKNSKFELAIRSRIHELGFRYRLHVRAFPRRVLLQQAQPAARRVDRIDRDRFRLFPGGDEELSLGMKSGSDHPIMSQ